MYVILKLYFNKNLMLGDYWRKYKSFWSTLRIILLTRHFAGVDASKVRQVSHIMVLQEQSIFFQKKNGKHDDHTIIMLWTVENMVIMPWSCHEPWRPFQETWTPCRHHGMIMTTFCHDHGMIMAWQSCFSSPGSFKTFSKWTENNIWIQTLTNFYCSYSVVINGSALNKRHKVPSLE